MLVQRYAIVLQMFLRKNTTFSTQTILGRRRIVREQMLHAQDATFSNQSHAQNNQFMSVRSLNFDSNAYNKDDMMYMYYSQLVWLRWAPHPAQLLLCPKTHSIRRHKTCTAILPCELDTFGGPLDNYE